MSLKETKNMSRGRPPATRARVLGYIENHKPSTIMQIVRATQAERSHVKRILRAAYGPEFRVRLDLRAKVGRPATFRHEDS